MTFFPTFLVKRGGEGFQASLPSNIVEDSLIQYQMMPGFSESPVIHCAGLKPGSSDTIVPYLVGLLQFLVESSVLSSALKYGMRLPMPLSSSGHEPNFFRIVMPLSPQSEEVRLQRVTKTILM